MSQLERITTDMLSSVYSGRPGCMCGCRGKHSYNSKHRVQSEIDCGRKLDDSDVNDRMVTRVLRLLQSLPPDEVTFEDGILSASIGNREYCAYLTAGAIEELATDPEQDLARIGAACAELAS